MLGIFCASLAAYIPNVTFSRQLLIPNHHKGVQEGQNGTLCPPLPPVYTYTCRKSIMKKKGQKQVKKKAFKINAKIEDVGLNED